MSLLFFVGVVLVVVYSLYGSACVCPSLTHSVSCSDYVYLTVQTATLSDNSVPFTSSASSAFTITATFVGCPVSDCGGQVDYSGLTAGYPFVLFVC